jgi:hypothetical protein
VDGAKNFAVCPDAPNAIMIIKTIAATIKAVPVVSLSFVFLAVVSSTLTIKAALV